MRRQITAFTFVAACLMAAQAAQAQIYPYVPWQQQMGPGGVQPAAHSGPAQFPIQPQQTPLVPCPSCDGCQDGMQTQQGVPTPVDAGNSVVDADSGAADSIPVPSDSSANVPMPSAGVDVASLGGDAGFASAGQAAAPNMIGDTFFAAGLFTFNANDPLPTAVPYLPSGGRHYRAATNNNALPQSRLIYNYNHFSESLQTLGVFGRMDQNINRHEAGFEYALCTGLTSLQVIFPFSDSLDELQDLSFSGRTPGEKDTDFGNISLALKQLIYRDMCRAISIGASIDLPTADDLTIDNTDINGQFLEVQNDTSVFSLYLGYTSTPGPNCFINAFVQGTIPMDDDSFVFDDGLGNIDQGSIHRQSLLHADISVGTWLWQNPCCCSGLAVMGEVHYTTTWYEDEELILFNGGTDNVYFQDNHDLLHGTVGFALVRGCWEVMPGFVFPLTGDPKNEAFEWEAALQVNRRF